MIENSYRNDKMGRLQIRVRILGNKTTWLGLEKRSWLGLGLVTISAFATVHLCIPL